jgi:hypothetical protein
MMYWNSMPDFDKVATTAINMPTADSIFPRRAVFWELSIFKPKMKSTDATI